MPTRLLRGLFVTACALQVASCSSSSMAVSIDAPVSVVDAPVSAVDAPGTVDAGGARSVTLSGQLTAGTFTGAPVSKLPANPPLAGYQLSCITFAVPPIAATATSDAQGFFNLSLDAMNVPLGCFILDPGGNSVASVVFASGSVSSLTVSFSENGDLGMIIVDIASGLAQVILPSSGMPVTTPPGGCPLGTWTVPISGTGIQCAGGVSATLWLVQQPSGQLVASYTVPQGVETDAGVVCNFRGESDLSATYLNGVLSFVVHDQNAACNDVSRTVLVTPDPQCQTATVTATRATCGSCGANGNCSGCGTTTCVTSFTATRN